MNRFPIHISEKTRLDNQLVEAANKGDVHGIRDAIHKGADVNYNQNWALMCAARRGSVEAIRELLENGADPRANNGRALSEAASNGSIAAAEKLISEGVDIAISGNQAAAAAFASQHGAMLRFLVSLGASTSEASLFRLADRGLLDLECISIVVDNGALSRPEPALHGLSLINFVAWCAFRYGASETFLYLCAKGADSKRAVLGGLPELFRPSNIVQGKATLRQRILLAEIGVSITGILRNNIMEAIKENVGELVRGDWWELNIFEDWVSGKLDAVVWDERELAQYNAKIEEYNTYSGY